MLQENGSSSRRCVKSKFVSIKANRYAGVWDPHPPRSRQKAKGKRQTLVSLFLLPWRGAAIAQKRKNAMKRWKICYCGGLILTAGFAARAGAQAVPAPPAAAGAAAVPAVPAAAAPAAAPAAPDNIWTFLCLSPEQKAACKTKFCNSALGQMLNNGLKPIGAISGGLMGNCCPSLNPADLNKPPDSAEGAAARIKADE